MSILFLGLCTYLFPHSFHKWIKTKWLFKPMNITKRCFIKKEIQWLWKIKLCHQASKAVQKLGFFFSEHTHMHTPCNIFPGITDWFIPCFTGNSKQFTWFSSCTSMLYWSPGWTSETFSPRRKPRRVMSVFAASSTDGGGPSSCSASPIRGRHWNTWIFQNKMTSSCN